jgi:hypothetical protein
MIVEVFFGFNSCEVTFHHSTLSFMKWIYLEVHMLLVKKKCNVCI